jgi:acetyl/propionyl-CoA carboxylase alpha subunit
VEAGRVSGIRVESGGASRNVRVEPGAAEVDGRRAPISLRELDASLRELTVEGVRHRVTWARDGDKVFVWCDGRTYAFVRARAGRAAGASDHGADLRAPMPGRVRRVAVPAGETVARGQVVLVLEAMKMEHAIRAPRDGVVRTVHVREGDLVDAGIELAEID